MGSYRKTRELHRLKSGIFILEVSPIEQTTMMLKCNNNFEFDVCNVQSSSPQSCLKTLHLNSKICLQSVSFSCFEAVFSISRLNGPQNLGFSFSLCFLFLVASCHSASGLWHPRLTWRTGLFLTDSYINSLRGCLSWNIS